MPRQLLNKPQHKIDIGLTYENKKTGWRASLWGDYYLHMLDSNTITNNGNYVHNDLGDGSTRYNFAKGGQQTYERKSFGIWNLLVQKQIDKDSVVYLGIDNLFNHRDDDQAMRERVYKLGINLKFDGISERRSLAREALAKAQEDGGILRNFITPPFDTKREVGTTIL